MLNKNTPGAKKQGQVEAPASYLNQMFNDIWWRPWSKLLASANARLILYISKGSVSHTLITISKYYVRTSLISYTCILDEHIKL